MDGGFVDNRGFLLDNDEVSDLLEIRHWWKNRSDVYAHEPPVARKPRAHSVNMDSYGSYQTRPARPMRPRRGGSGRRAAKHRKTGSKAKVGGIRNVIDRAVRRSLSTEFGEVGGHLRQGSDRRRARNYRQNWLRNKRDDDSEEDSDESSRLMDKFQQVKQGSLPSTLHPDERRDWEKLTVEQQLERLKNSARREALLAQAKLWEAQEKQKLLEQLSSSENLQFVRQALGKMKDGSQDPIFKRLTNCVMDDDTPAGHSGANGRTRRNSDGEIFE